MINNIQIADFMKMLEQTDKAPLVFDARSEKEYTHAHIPNAINLALFTNEERAHVGTIYKQEGREAAILKGLEYVGVKMSSYIKIVNRHYEEYQSSSFNGDESTGYNAENEPKDIYIYCARGGMRSASLAWLLDLYGYNVHLIVGGYKLFRRYVLASFEREYDVILLGGNTGSSKTLVLKDLASIGENVVDLEGIAHHKGSAFGALGEEPQPSQEMFENKLCLALDKMQGKKSIWLEDESLLIGRLAIPKPFWYQMQNTRLITYLEIPLESRAKYLASTYGLYDKEGLIESVKRITKRLGGVKTKEAVEFIEAGNYYEAAIILLSYYDKSYKSACSHRECTKVSVSFDEYSVNIASTIKQHV